MYSVCEIISRKVCIFRPFLLRNLYDFSQNVCIFQTFLLYIDVGNAAHLNTDLNMITNTRTRREFDHIPTREEFISWMTEDILTHKSLYEAECLRIREEQQTEYRNRAIERIREEVNLRYKRQSTRDKYFIQKFDAWESKMKNRGVYVDTMSSIRWSIRPWENGGCFIISLGEGLEERLGNLYDDHVDNKYFKVCLGWEIVDGGDVSLILTEEDQARWTEDANKLYKSIQRFYAGSNYWGD